MDNSNFYRMYQVVGSLSLNYGFKQVIIRQYAVNMMNEIWLTNYNDPHYQIIRVTLNTAERFSQDEERINAYLNYFSNEGYTQLRFLDIHICSDRYDESLEKYPYLNLEEKYHDGTDVSAFYPKIYFAINTVEDQNLEVKRITSELEKDMRQSSEFRKKKQNRTPYVTYIIIGICSFMYLLEYLLQRKYPESAVMIFLGADYMTFTLGLKQLWRLVATAFLHGSVFHLIMNMYSLFLLGRIMEPVYGRKFYIGVLFCSIIVGSLTQDILSANTISIGLSGGIYGLLMVFIVDMLQRKAIQPVQLVPLVTVNLLINFMSTTAWKAHVGGMICGFVMFTAIKMSDDKRAGITLTAVLIAGLLLKFLTIDKINPLYQGTDLAVYNMFKGFGLNASADRLLRALADVYSKYGG